MRTRAGGLTMYSVNRRRALMLGAGAVVFAACGGDDDASGPADTSAANTSDPPAAPANPPASTNGTPATPVTSITTAGGAPEGIPPIQEYDLDAVFRFMWNAPPTSFDPHKAGASYDLTTLQPVYDRLLHLTPAGVPGPGLATAWEFAADGTYLDLTLRDGVVFHDGAVLDADAVKANVERAKTVEGSAVASDLAAIDSVEVMAPNAVRLHLARQAAELPAVLTDRAGMMISPNAFENPDLDVAPVGAGMYRVTSYDPGARITFERFEEYWEPDAIRAAGLDWGVSGDPLTRFNALRSGQIDGTWLGSAQDAEAQAAGLKVLRRSGTGFFHVQLDRSFEPFADVDVRRAMNHALDRQALVDSVAYGLGHASSQSFPEGYFAFDPDTGTDAFPYDPELARQLLTNAGYPNGFEFEMLFQTSQGGDVIAAALQGQFAAVGITANARGIETAQAAEAFYVREEGDALAANWGGRPDPTQTLRLLYTATGFANSGKHSTEATTAAIEATAVVQPAEARATAARAASAQVVADALDVVVYFLITSYGFSNEVLGPDVWGFGFPDFRYVGKSKS